VGAEGGGEVVYYWWGGILIAQWAMGQGVGTGGERQGLYGGGVGVAFLWRCGGFLKFDVSWGVRILNSHIRAPRLVLHSLRNITS
jgi:hypothetical protein